MSLDAQARVFDPFFTTKSAGHGLGLAVVQGIVRGLGGAIHLESEPGRGTKFRILLPAAEKMAPPARPASAAPVAEDLNHSAMILVVEDEAPLRLAVTKFLRMKGLSVIEAADGTVALNLVREHKDEIALVLLDITLPGAPSHDVYAEACRTRPDMRVIVTSAYGQNMVDASFPGLKVDSFIRKPYQLADLADMVRKALAA
jgi:CheY-like chemotaxis protein